MNKNVTKESVSLPVVPPSPHPHLVTCPSTLTRVLRQKGSTRLYSSLPDPKRSSNRPLTRTQQRAPARRRPKGSSRSRALSPPLLLPSRRPNSSSSFKRARAANKSLLVRSPGPPPAAAVAAVARAREPATELPRWDLVPSLSPF